jgi:hypothetical protein
MSNHYPKYVVCKGPITNELVVDCALNHRLVNYGVGKEHIGSTITVDSSDWKGVRGEGHISSIKEIKKIAKAAANLMQFSEKLP